MSRTESDILPGMKKFLPRLWLPNETAWQMQTIFAQIKRLSWKTCSQSAPLWGVSTLSSWTAWFCSAVQTSLCRNFCCSLWCSEQLLRWWSHSNPHLPMDQELFQNRCSNSQTIEPGTPDTCDKLRCLFHSWEVQIFCQTRRKCGRMAANELTYTVMWICDMIEVSPDKEVPLWAWKISS